MMAQQREQVTASAGVAQTIALAYKSGVLTLSGRGLTEVPSAMWQAPPADGSGGGGGGGGGGVSFDRAGEGWWSQCELVC